jgi:type II secretory pathway pseudopilin PulG
MKNIKTQKNKKLGFSLVEMLVATGVFMSIMTIAVTALISIIDANKKAQAIKNTIDNVTFAIETISRDMRIGKDYGCYNIINGTFTQKTDCSAGSDGVIYTNSSGQQVEYLFSTDISKPVLLEKIGDAASVDLISRASNVNIANMKFYVIGAATEKTLGTQPRVIITISGSITAKGSSPTTFDLQTSISQRARQ